MSHTREAIAKAVKHEIAVELTQWAAKDSLGVAQPTLVEVLRQAVMRGVQAVPEEIHQKNTTRLVQVGDVEEEVWRCEACDEDWVLEAGTPEENHMRYCTACGRRIIEVVRNQEEDQ